MREVNLFVKMKRWEKGGKGKIGDEGKDALLTETTVPNKIKTFPASQRISIN